MSNKSVTTFVLIFLLLNTLTISAAIPGITLVGKGSVDGNLLDESGLAGDICQAGVPLNCVPAAISLKALTSIEPLK